MKSNRTLVACVVLLLLLPTFSFAQIPNAGFEDWTSGSDTLIGWWINNVPPLYSTVSKTTTAHGGTTAVRGEVIQFYTQTLQPVLQTGDGAGGFSFSQRPVSITGYYQFYPAGSSGDRFAVNVGLFKGGVNGIGVAVAAIAPSATVTSYTKFTATFNYQTSDTPDTCVIQFQIVGPGQGPQAKPTVGSYFLLDDLAFEGTTGVAENRSSVPSAFQLEQNYPNPFNPSTNVSFTVPGEGRAKLTVYNLMGQEVTTLFEGSVSAGRFYHFTFNASPYPSGVYFSKLQFAAERNAGVQMMMRKMVLIK